MLNLKQLLVVAGLLVFATSCSVLDQSKVYDDLYDNKNGGNLRASEDYDPYDETSYSRYKEHEEELEDGDYYDPTYAEENQVAEANNTAMTSYNYGSSCNNRYRPYGWAAGPVSAGFYNSWNSPYYGMNSWGMNPYGNNWYTGVYYGNSWGNPYGFNTWGSTYGWNSWNNPYGWNSWNSPYYNSWNNPYGWNSWNNPYGYNSWNNPYGWNSWNSPHMWGGGYSGMNTFGNNDFGVSSQYYNPSNHFNGPRGQNATVVSGSNPNAQTKSGMQRQARPTPYTVSADGKSDARPVSRPFSSGDQASTTRYTGNRNLTASSNRTPVQEVNRSTRPSATSRNVNKYRSSNRNNTVSREPAYNNSYRNNNVSTGYERRSNNAYRNSNYNNSNSGSYNRGSSNYNRNNTGTRYNSTPSRNYSSPSRSNSGSSYRSSGSSTRSSSSYSSGSSSSRSSSGSSRSSSSSSRSGGRR